MVSDKQEIHAIFNEAIVLVSENDRLQYLDQACGGDLQMRARVDALLNAHSEAGGFFGGKSDVDATKIFPITEHPGTIIGPYKLLQQIGEGGMGVVFMAEQTEPIQRSVALKIIKPGMDTRQVIARFEAERQALAMMDHPNIARVLDAGTTDTGRPYFVMDLVKGVSITKYCDEKQLSLRERLELFMQVCQAVQHAHQKGIIHRDIKPNNVLVAEYDHQAVPKVIDFGVAKATAQKLTERTMFTEFGQVLGTMEYMSPEQAKFNQLDIDTRSDIYSLGVLLYELLAGSTPFEGKRLHEAAFDEMLRIIREEEPPKPSTRLSTTNQLPSIAANRGAEPNKLSGLLQGELDWVVMKALEKDRNRRYETASAFAADVKRYLHDEAVQACPPSAAYRLRKFARRNKRTFAAASAAAIVLLLSVVGLTISNVLIARERNQKVEALNQAKISEETANEQRRQAQENLKDALAAVDQMLTRVSEERLQDMPQMEPVRRDLLQDALKFYQRFLERRSDDPAIRRETALAYRRMASLHYQLGDYPRSEDAYRKAFAMFDRLEDESPLEITIRREFAGYYIGFSWVLRNQGKLEEGEKILRRAVRVAEELVQEFPGVPAHHESLADARNRLAYAIADAKPDEAEAILRGNLALTDGETSFQLQAQTWRDLGLALAKRRRYSQAEDAYRHGVSFFEKALARAPSSLVVRGGLADALSQLAKTLDAGGRPHEAEEIYRRAIPISDDLAADFPAGPHNRWGQAEVQFQHALLLRKLKRPAEAEQAYRRTVELFDKLANDFPTLPGYQQTAIARRYHLVKFLMEAGRRQEAEQLSAETTAILDKLAAPQRSNALRERGHFFADLEDWDKAAGDFRQAIELGSDDILGVWCPLALVRLAVGRTDEYRSVCERMLERSESHWVVGVCTLAPKAVVDLSRPVDIAEELVAREPQNADFLAILGFALYRQGDWEGAVRRLEASLGSGPGPSDVHSLKLFLAMAYHCLGRGAEAQQLFQEVTRWRETHAEMLKGGANPPGPPAWAYRLALQRLHREAEEVLKQDPGLKSQNTETSKGQTDP
jgi:eukaryotic-like serine/threonine-protein kinase